MSATEERETSSYSSVLLKERNPWGLSDRGQQAKKMMMAALKLDHGMYAKIPIVCKGEDCPYASQCLVFREGMAPVGEYCPVEIANIETRAVGYIGDVDINTLSFTDKCLLSELVALDVMLERCKSLMANDVTPVVDIAIGTDQNGETIYQPAVAKSWDAFERISKRRDNVYNLLMLTRKDKAKVKKEDEMTSTIDLLQQVIDTDDIVLDEKE